MRLAVKTTWRKTMNKQNLHVSGKGNRRNLPVFLILSIIVVFVLSSFTLYGLTVDGHQAHWLFYVSNLNDNHVEYYALTQSATDCRLIDDDEDTLYNRWHNTNHIADDKPEYEPIAWYEEFVYGIDDVVIRESSRTRSEFDFRVEAFSESDALSNIKIHSVIELNAEGVCEATTTMNLAGQDRVVVMAKVYENQNDDMCFRVDAADNTSYHFCED